MAQEVVALLRAEAVRLDSRIACMSLSRRTIQDYLDRIGTASPSAE